MIAICVGLCFLTSLVFGFLPAIRFSRPAIISALKDDAGAGGLRVGRVHRFTAALQVAIAVPLLVIGGICLDRVRSTAISDLGFESGLLYAAPLELDAGPEDPHCAEHRFSNPKPPGHSCQDERHCIRHRSGWPAAGRRGRPATVSLQTDANVAPALVRVQVTRVGDSYLSTMGIPLLSGRDFSGDDSAGSEKVTLITKPLADRLFPNAGAVEAIGKRIDFRRRR